MSDAYDPYPFESDDDEEIRELDLESVDTFGEARITVGDLVSEHESWRFGHVIVDEAQDLTPMQWRMIMRRVRGRSLTVVGDLAQRTIGQAGEWAEHLPAELAAIDRRDLTINYRSPTEINDLAAVLLQEIAPGVSHSRSIRSVGVSPRFICCPDPFVELTDVVAELRSQVAGQIAVIVADERALGAVDDHAVRRVDERVSILASDAVKGLEFDAVVVVEPADIWALPGGGAHLYVALTRPTQRLVVMHAKELPSPLRHSAAAS